VSITFEHDGIPVTVLDGPYIEHDSTTAAAVEECSRLVGSLDRFRQFAAEKLLRLYNEGWLDDDIGPLVRDAIVAKLVNPSVHLHHEAGAAVVYFEDGGLFAGHSIEVSVDKGVPGYAASSDREPASPSTVFKARRAGRSTLLEAEGGDIRTFLFAPLESS
jgi:hypothetical protein